MKKWPPDGYSEPKEWEDSETGVLVIAAVVAFPMAFYFGDTIAQIVNPVWGRTESLSSWFILDGTLLDTLLVGIAVVILVLLLACLFFACVIIPIHELIHYGVDLVQGQNPKFTTKEFLFVKNPGVINLSIGFSGREYIPSALSPFLIIGVVSLLCLRVTDGFIEGMAAFVLVMNSGVSGADIYNSIKVASLPRGTIFSNFERDGEYKSEYAIPSGKDS